MCGAWWSIWRGALLGLIPVFLGLSLTIFLLIHLIPGDPAQVMLGFRATPEAVARLHQPGTWTIRCWTQYLYFLGGC